MWRCESCRIQITYALSHRTLGPVCPVCQRPTKGGARGWRVEPPVSRPVVGGGVVVVVDASFDDGLAGLAAVADGHDEIVRQVENARSAHHAEQLAISRAIERIRVLGWPRGVILSDSTGAVAALNRARALPEGWALRWVRRDRVQLAHRVARREMRAYRG